MRNGRSRYLFWGIFLCSLLFAFGFPNGEAQAKTQKVVYTNQLAFKSTLKSDSEIRLTWKKKVKNAKAVITRKNIGTKKKQVITVDSYQGEYIDTVAFGATYEYTMKITKKGKKKTMVYKEHGDYVFLGVGEVEFSIADSKEYDAYRPTVTEDAHVQLGARENMEGIKPTGYLFFKSVDNLHYQEIADVEKPSFLDTDTELGRIYFYKAQAYYVYQGERVYGKKSKYNKVYVSYQKPVITSSVVRKEEKTGDIRVKITSDPKNPMVFLNCSETSGYLPFYEEKDGVETAMGYQVAAYSVNEQKSWLYGEFFFEIRLMPGESVYFLLKPSGKTWETVVKEKAEKGFEEEPVDFFIQGLTTSTTSLGGFWDIDRTDWKLDLLSFGRFQWDVSEKQDE